MTSIYYPWLSLAGYMPGIRPFWSFFSFNWGSKGEKDKKLKNLGQEKAEAVQAAQQILREHWVAGQG